jgi:hypothetical protein
MDGNGSTETLEVHFCNPVYQNNEDGKKKSLVFLRDTVTADEKLKRSARLTSGDLTFASSDIQYNDDGEITGIKLFPSPTSDVSTSAVCKENTPYTVSMLVKCDNAKTSLAVTDFSIVRDAGKCTLDITATHKAGCGAIKASGFVQYLNSKPWLIALITIAGGIATCFFGGLLFDWIMIGIPAFFSFLFVAVVLSSSIGVFAVLEEDRETTAKGVILAIFGALIAGLAAFAAGYVAKKTKQIAMGIVGAIGGFFLGFLLYSLVFAMFIKSSTILLWLTLIAFSALGGFAIFKYQEEMELHVTVFIGAYLIIRGIAFFAGGYPDEAQTFYQLQKGNFDLPFSFYLYVAGFIVLNILGTIFQHRMGYDQQTPSKTAKNLPSGDDDNFKSGKSLVENGHSHKDANHMA